MYKTPTFAEPQQYNRPFSTDQLSAFIIDSDGKLGCCYPAVKEKNKKSCNKNAIKNIEMLEKYIYPIKKIIKVFYFLRMKVLFECKSVAIFRIFLGSPMF